MDRLEGTNMKNNQVTSYRLKVSGLMMAALFVLGACVPAVQPTIDPFLVVAQAAKLTATAEAPMIAMTQQMANLSISQTQTADYRTSVALSFTPTPSVTPTITSTPTITAPPTINVTGTLAVEKMNADIETIRLDVENARSTNTIRAAAPWVLLTIVVVLMVIGFYVAMRRASMMSIPVDERGNIRPMFDVVEGVAVDADRMTNAAMTIRRKDVIAYLPAITPDRQDAVTARDQAVDMQTRMPPRRISVKQDVPMLNAPELPAFNLAETFPVPDWSIMDGWDPKTGLAYGVSRMGLQTFAFSKTPHVGVIGKTGSGKSRRFLRPIIACALAAGHRVVIIGKSADYWPFENHPNVALATVRDLTNETEAAKYEQYLRSIIEEMNRRDEYLTSVRKSTWEQAGQPGTIVVLDELTNALDLMPRENRLTCRRYLTGLTREGRKVGLHVVFAAQRAVGIREVITQVGKAVFFVEDAQESRFALGMPGAEKLQEGYFYAQLGQEQLVGAFEPSDEDLRVFLEKRPVQDLGKPQFIDLPALESRQEEMPLIVPTEDKTNLHVDEIRRAIDLLDEGKTLGAVIREIWNVTGGSRYYSLKKQLEGLTSSTSSTSSSGNQASLGTFAA
jgi:hypothetical protein